MKRLLHLLKDQRWSLVLITLLLSSVVDVRGQSPSEKDTIKSNIVGPLVFKGTVEELTKSIKGAIVTVYEDEDGTKENLTEVKKLVTPGNGTFEVKFEINKFYLITVEKSGYTAKGIDVDTDVRLARSQYTKVPPFEFKVDMVPDKDGLSFKKSVASVFYQIKRNAFDYELDYSKEELEEEERLLREQEEKRKLAELAAQKKFEMEEAAKLLREQDDATMEQKIKAAITVGNEDKDVTIAALTEIFPINDTLRDGKAVIIYEELQRERKTEGKAISEIDFKALFAAAEAYGEEVAQQVEQEQEAKVEELRAVRLDAERKKEAAMAVQQQALELEQREKIAAANLQAEEARAKEEKERNDQVYYAIFNSGGDSKTAIANLVKTFPRGDKYSKEKAEAIYAEYEQIRLSGTTLAKMDFGKLFAAADQAEQKAVKEEIEREDAKNRMRAESYMEKQDAKKMAEEQKYTDAILDGLKTASKDDQAQMQVFIESLPKNDPFREEKGRAMYDEYVRQKQGGSAVAIPEDILKRLKSAPQDERSQKAVLAETFSTEDPDRGSKTDALYEEYRAQDAAAKKLSISPEVLNKLRAAPQDKVSQVAVLAETFPVGDSRRNQKAEAIYEQYEAQKKALNKKGNAQSKVDFSSLFTAASSAEKNAEAEKRIADIKSKEAEQERLEALRQQARDEKIQMGEEAAREAREIHTVKMNAAKNKREKEIGQALEEGGGDRDRTVQAILKTFPKGTEMPEMKAEAMFEAYLLESERLKASGGTAAKLDYSVLFAAAEQAELRALQQQYEEKQKDEEKQLIAYEEQRMERVKEAATEIAQESTLALAVAEKTYQETAIKVEKEREERIRQEQQAREEMERQRAMELAKRDVKEREVEDEVLARMERERKEREQARMTEEERLAAARLEEQQLAEAAAKAEAERRIAEVEEGRQLALEAQRKAEAERAKEEARKATEAEKQQMASQELAAKAEADRQKQVERLAAEAEKARLAAEEAEAKAKADKEREEQRLLAEAERSLLLAEERKAREKERLAAEAEKARIAEELAAAKSEEERAKEQQRLAAEAEKARIAAEQAAAKEEADRIKEQERLAAVAAKEEADRKKEAERLAAEAEKARIAAEQAAAKAEADRIKEQERLAAEAAQAEADRKRQEELAAAAEQKRQEELEQQRLAEAKRKREEQITDLNNAGAKANTEKRYADALASFKQVLAIDPENTTARSGVSSAQSAMDAIAKAEAEQKALDEQYNSLVGQGQQQLAANDLSSAKTSFTQANALKPADNAAKQGLAQVKQREDELAAAEEEKRQTERQFIMLMQEGDRAMGANNFSVAKLRYTEAAELKPNEAGPRTKLTQIAAAEEELAQQAEAKRVREEEAKRKFEEQQVATELARLEAMAAADAAKVEDEEVGLSEEEKRAKEFDRIKANVEKLNLNAEDQRKTFLSALAKLYPEGVTEEVVNAKNYKVIRNVINDGGVVTVYEQRTWDWGGVFWFKNGDVSITESLYKLELSRFGK